MDRLNRRDLFKLAVGAVGVAVVGKVAPEAAEVRNHSTGWLRMAEPGEGITSGYVPRGIPTIDDNIKPIRADEVWSALQKAQQQYPLLTLTQGSTRNWPCTDEGMPSIWSTMDSNTFGWTKYTAGPDGMTITNDAQPDITLNGQPYWLMHDTAKQVDDWEEGEGFDG